MDTSYVMFLDLNFADLDCHRSKPICHMSRVKAFFQVALPNISTWYQTRHDSGFGGCFFGPTGAKQVGSDITSTSRRRMMCRKFYSFAKHGFPASQTTDESLYQNVTLGGWFFVKSSEWIFPPTRHLRSFGTHLRCEAWQRCQPGHREIGRAHV